MVGRLWLRVARTAVVCVGVAAAWYGLSYNRDWFYFHWHQNTVMRDIGPLLEALRSTGLTMSELGPIQYGAEPLAIWGLHQPAKASSGLKHTVCLLAGVHGNEPAGVQALLSVASELGSKRPAWPDHHYVIVPLANPWGWMRNLRHNGDNRDVARQFVNGQSQESALLKSFLLARRCTLLVDLHEDRFRDGFYLLAYAPSKAESLNRVVNGVARQSGLPHANRGTQGVFQIEESEFPRIRLTTASLWARMNGVPHSFILETPESAPLEQRVLAHKAAIRELLATLDSAH